MSSFSYRRTIIFRSRIFNPGSEVQCQPCRIVRYASHRTYASPYHLGAEILVNDGQPTTFAPVWEPETIVTQRVIRPSYFYTFSTLCGKFMLLLAQALYAVCPGIVVISGIWPSYKCLYYPESTLSIRFEIVWSVWLSVLGNPWYLVLFRLCCVHQTCLYLRIFYALCRVVSASGLRF